MYRGRRRRKDVSNTKRLAILTIFDYPSPKIRGRRSNAARTHMNHRSMRTRIPWVR